MKRIIIRFYQSVIMTIFIIVFASCSALKQNNKVSAEDSEEKIKEIKPEWLECKASIDCIKVRGFCKLPAVIHTKYKDKFLDFIKNNKPPIDCSRYKNINYESIVEAACENKQCKLIIP